MTAPTSLSLAPGFLIAMPQLADPNFKRSVILMLEYSAAGGMGLILNRPAPFGLREVAKSQSMAVSTERKADAVYFGGPVEPHRGFVLHDRAEIDEKEEIIPGVYLSVTLDSLEPLLTDDAVKFRFCLGYAGWGPKQLDKEIASGTWLFAEATKLAVLEVEALSLWETVLQGMGVNPAMLVLGKGVH